MQAKMTSPVGPPFLRDNSPALGFLELLEARACLGRFCISFKLLLWIEGCTRKTGIIQAQTRLKFPI